MLVNRLGDLEPFLSWKGAVCIAGKENESKRMGQVEIPHVGLVQAYLWKNFGGGGCAEAGQHLGVCIQARQGIPLLRQGQENAPRTAAQFQDGITIFFCQRLPKREIIRAEGVVGVVQLWLKGGHRDRDHILTSESVWHYTGVYLRGVAQLVARRVWDAEVRGSSPRTPTDHFRCDLTFGSHLHLWSSKMFGKKMADGVVEGVRYDAQGQVEWVRMYQRRGAIYSDWTLVKRPALVEMLKAGKRVFIGTRIPFQAGTFETGPALKVIERGGKEVVVTGEAQAEKDKLDGVPVV